ncbi:MAG: choice-of-anchor L domain-containing protein, partial [Chitinophagales bacterium]|nr:choice-of-anchor L domain-containing protein [Chitinophagales bacterium]MDW8274665.1 choice-of-anchor L domain-containing protein [Chitinophagales bacterium]
MMKNQLVLFLSLLLLETYVAFSQITLNPSGNANALAQSLAGQGVTISNASLSAAANAVGFFNANPNTNLGIGSGIILTTGQLSDIPQDANAGLGGIGASFDNGAGGDPQLQNLSGYLIYNASALTFDVTPLGNTLTFRYVFMSEEYPDYVCSEYNDVFGFFVSGPRPQNLGGGNYSNVNIALVPNTNLPVGINTVNSGVPGSGYDITDCQGSNTIYFRNNFGNPYIVYNAGTVVLTATIQVIPCSTYTFKLAIGDGSDALFDSGVFLEAGSFTSNTATINTVFSHTGYTTTYEGCSSASVIFNFTAPFAGSAVFDYVISGTATN